MPAFAFSFPQIDKFKRKDRGNSLCNLFLFIHVGSSTLTHISCWFFAVHVVHIGWYNLGGVITVAVMVGELPFKFRFDEFQMPPKEPKVCYRN